MLGRLVLLVILVLLSSSSVARADEASSPAASPRELFRGTFRYAGDAQQEAARRAAIDKTIDSLFFAIRGIARSRLSKGTPIDYSVTIAFDDSAASPAARRIRVKVPAAPEAISPESGAVTPYNGGDEPSKLSQRIVGSMLTQTFQAEEGRRENQWTISPDGKTLMLKVIVSSPKLSVPLTYVLTYKRAN